MVAFAKRHYGYKESKNARSKEYLLVCRCGSERLRWRHEPGVKEAWICWGCRRSGDTVQLVQWLEQLNDEDAVEFILKGYEGGDAVTMLTDPTRPERVVHLSDREALKRLAVIRWPKGVDIVADNEVSRRAWVYLLGRGLTREQVFEYRVGFGRHGRLAGYVVFPIFMDGGLVYYQGRATWDPPAGTSEHRRAWVKATGYRKTLNPVNRDGNASAEQVLFNYDRAMVEPHVVICEGPIDAIKVGQHAVALFGKVPSNTKIERLLRMHAQRYTIYLDPGDEERDSAEQLAAELSGFAPTFIATPPDGSDPGSLSQEENRRVLGQAEPYRPGLRTGAVSI